MLIEYNPTKVQVCKMKLRIIVIDMDESLRTLITIIAQKKGHEVIALSEPIVCQLYSDLDCCCSQEHACGDLMIISNRMAKMSGLKLIEKQLEGGCKGATQNKLVLSTSIRKNREFSYAKELGCTVIMKPFKISEISAWIDECEMKIDPNRKLADLH
jgi:DNA-binding response OmpR family regulator